MSVKATVFVAASLGWCAMHQTASAQYLTGVKEVGVLVEGLSPNAQGCNITEAALDAAVRVPLGQSNTMRVTSSGDELTYVYVNVSALKFDDECYANVVVQLKRPVRAMNAPEARPFIATAWEQGGILSSSQGNMSRRMMDSVERYTKQLIAQWMKDNPK
jgi:hypothetical protein